MSARPSRQVWNSLIRTHHITSRKKVAKLRQAAAKEGVHALLRTGSPPGIMYVEGEKSGVERWVASVQKLRYKDFLLAVRPAEIDIEKPAKEFVFWKTGLFETESVKEFASQMDGRGILTWWRKGMGYIGDEGRL